MLDVDLLDEELESSTLPIASIIKQVNPIDEMMDNISMYKLRMGIADDIILKETTLQLLPEASAYKLKAVISGHGHAGPRNCCEWDSKTHTYYINEWDLFRWNVWKDCGNNPIYPQGGTWPFDRAGWCPGTDEDGTIT